MRMLAQWVPTTPSMEAKILFGRHIWDCARHADAFGKRAFELRAPLHYTLPCCAPFRSLLEDIVGLDSAADRVAGFYDAACPALTERYRRYIESTDSLMDEPTVRILQDSLRDFERMQSERSRLVAGLSLGECTFRPLDWRTRERSIDNFVEHGGEMGRARGVSS